jgi:hypothetical protein
VIEDHMPVSKSQISPGPRLTEKILAVVPVGKPDVDIAQESAFLKTLRQEVRRTERSGRPFVLALVSGGGLGQQGGPRIVRDLAGAITSLIRETD